MDLAQDPDDGDGNENVRKVTGLISTLQAEVCLLHSF